MEFVFLFALSFCEKLSKGQYSSSTQMAKGKGDDQRDTKGAARQFHSKITFRSVLKAALCMDSREAHRGS
ncbi:unnamed protein product [Urochloa humidicola]